MYDDQLFISLYYFLVVKLNDGSEGICLTRESHNCFLPNKQFILWFVM